MKLNALMFAVLFVVMLALIAHMHVERREQQLSGVATALPQEDETLPSPVFIDWHSEGERNIFDMLMPWGKNGTEATLLMGDVPVASTTLPERTPFAERTRLEAPTPPDGFYTYSVRLCTSPVATSSCRISSPIALFARGGKFMREDDLSTDEQTVERANELRQQRAERAAEYYAAQDTRMHGLVPTVAMLQEHVELQRENNLDRIRRIVTSDARRALFAPTNTISRADFYAAVAKFPAFCNEAVAPESLDSACKRELAAVIAYVTYFTSTGEANANSGMHNPPAMAFLIGNDALRFAQVFPPEDGASYQTLADRFEKHPEDALLAALWWYMTPQSPEPDPHSALLGIWMPNDTDRSRNILPGFGATINIATHGASCLKGTSFERGYLLRTLYRNFLVALNATDDFPDMCEAQSAFALSGSAFLPQYWRADPLRGTCILDVIENSYFVQEKGSRERCQQSLISSSTSTNTDAINEDYHAAVLRVDALEERVGLGSGLSGESAAASDPRTALGAIIAGTYLNWRTTQKESQPEYIPFAKMNTLFFEGAYPDTAGELRFWDSDILNNTYFAGDCFREECKRGLLHQFALAHNRYPSLAVVLSIGGWDGSENFGKLSDTHLRKKFIESIHDFLVAYPQFSGVDISWMYPKGVEGNTALNPGGDMETMRLLVVDMRAMLNALYENDGVLRKFYLGVGAAPDALQAVGLSTVSSMVDGIHLVTYDLHGPWEPLTGHDAQLFATNISGDTLSVANAVAAARKEGVPAKKMIIGIPYYGRIWKMVDKGSNPLLPGLFGLPHATDTATLVDYRTIRNDILGKGEYQYYEDALRGAAYLYDGSTFVSYDTPEIIEAKMQYVWKDGFGGVLLADIMGDDGTLQDRVLNVIAQQSEKKSCKLARQPDRNLATNSRGADVFALQTFLSCLGDFPTHIDITGNYGAATEEGVRTFQRAEGLPVTGVVGKETRDRLSIY